ncbi:MAG: OmpA family protein [Panacagrimonas sp.]
MNPLPIKTLLATAVASLLLAACSAGPTRPQGADNARTKLTALQSDPQLASLAPVAIKEAEAAVVAAEKPQEDKELGQHLVLMADRKVEIASSQAQSLLLENQRKTLSEQRESARLDSRTREADAARGDATAARTEAEIARGQADSARMDSAAAKLQAEELQRRMTEMDAKATDRGLVVTLGDVLFSTGRSDLKGGATSNLGKLVTFLNEYPDRTVTIEGHTDDVGSDDSNLGLSTRRADAVKSYLVNQGVASARLVASGKGEGSPVAGNDSATGRQQNRRVEVIIANAVTSMK